MTNYSSAVLDGTFQALASGTRRDVLTQLARGPATVTALAHPFAMALPSFLRHVTLLERAGCIRTEKAGRVRTCHLVRDPFDGAQAWLVAQRGLWEARTDRLEHFVTEEDL
jgi:DNA-binding transcriptional ArsR family regulator